MPHIHNVCLPLEGSIVVAKATGKSGKRVVTLGNPVGITVILTILTLVAKVLKTLGILDDLEKRAEETETDVDNVAIRIAKIVLEELAK